jgi:hypothetical protein
VVVASAWAGDVPSSSGPPPVPVPPTSVPQPLSLAEGIAALAADVRTTTMVTIHDKGLPWLDDAAKALGPCVLAAHWHTTLLDLFEQWIETPQGHGACRVFANAPAAFQSPFQVAWINSGAGDGIQLYTNRKLTSVQDVARNETGVDFSKTIKALPMSMPLGTLASLLLADAEGRSRDANLVRLCRSGRFLQSQFSGLPASLELNVCLTHAVFDPQGRPCYTTFPEGAAPSLRNIEEDRHRVCVLVGSRRQIMPKGWHKPGGARARVALAARGAIRRGGSMMAAGHHRGIETGAAKLVSLLAVAAGSVLASRERRKPKIFIDIEETLLYLVDGPTADGSGALLKATSEGRVWVRTEAFRYDGSESLELGWRDGERARGGAPPPSSRLEVVPAGIGMVSFMREDEEGGGSIRCKVGIAADAKEIKRRPHSFPESRLQSPVGSRVSGSVELLRYRAALEEHPRFQAWRKEMGAATLSPQPPMELRIATEGKTLAISVKATPSFLDCLGVDTSGVSFEDVVVDVDLPADTADVWPSQGTGKSSVKCSFIAGSSGAGECPRLIWNCKRLSLKAEAVRLEAKVELTGGPLLDALVARGEWQPQVTCRFRAAGLKAGDRAKVGRMLVRFCKFSGRSDHVQKWVRYGEQREVHVEVRQGTARAVTGGHNGHHLHEPKGAVEGEDLEEVVDESALAQQPIDGVVFEQNYDRA